jgi:hypothetical protein
MVSVKLDVLQNARVAAAAALAGIDKSSFCAKAIDAALAGIVVFDRNNPKSNGHGDPSSEGRSEDAA